MHHLYPGAKGDPLCPLGFHPQVRWPTRCKRCFRDYKEHGGRNKDQSLKKDETTVSSPSLSSWSSPSSRSRDDSRSGSNDSGVSARSWTTSNTYLSSSSKPEDSTRFSTDSLLSTSKFGVNRPASSWTSTPDLGKLTEDTHADVTTVSLTLPRRRPVPVDTGQVETTTESLSLPRRKVIERSPPRDRATAPTPNTSTNSYSSRRNRDTAKETAAQDIATTKQRRVQIQSLKEVKSIESNDPEVEFVLQVKSSKTNSKPVAKATNSVLSSSSTTGKKTSNNLSLLAPVVASSSSSSGTSSEEYEDDSDDDAASMAGTETTETDTLIDPNENELQDQIDSLKQELELMKTRCDRVEREKSDILLRRIAAMDTAPSKTAASEVLKLQQRVNEFSAMTEDLRDEKKVLTLKVKELEDELEQRPDAVATKKTIDELRSKLLAAETLCEELMDENEDMKKELRDLEEEIEEMQDNFREDQADEYTTLRKELEQTAKNCRILSFKLRKSERKIEQLEADKTDAERRVGGGPGLERIKHLEQELSVANEVAKRLQKELEESSEKLKVKEDSTKDDPKGGKKKPPMLGVIGKVSSGEKISRESLTRGGSQDDPVQLLRDLQDSMEREADLREQLKYAEEEAQSLRKKSSRVEDDNESLVLQLKKMATKARSRRHSPSPARLTPEPPVEKDEGISDEEDPAELRLLLELNEQEASVLRRKVEDMEKEGDIMKRKVKDLQEKLNVKTTRKNTVFSMSSSSSDSGKSNPLQEQKIKVMEEELSEVRKKLIEKDRDCERLNAELTVTQKRFSKGSMQKSKSLDLGNEQQTLDLKRQLQVIEQEASILRSRTQTLETENDKILAENKRLQMYRGPKKISALKELAGTSDNSKELQEKIAGLEAQLKEASNKVKEQKQKLDDQETELNDPKKKGMGLKDTVELTKLKKEVKTKSEESEKLAVQVTKFEGENEKLNDVLKRLKEESVENIVAFYKARTPKKPTDFTTKIAMKKMVEDLESEIGEVLVALKRSESEKSKLAIEAKPTKDPVEEAKLKEAKEKLEKDLEENKQRLEELTKELKDEREKAEKDKKKVAKDKKLIEESKKKLEETVKKMEEDTKKRDEDMKKIEEIKNRIETEKNAILEENNQMKYEKLKFGLEIEKLTSEKGAAIAKQDEVPVYIRKIDCLKNELDDQRRQCDSFRKQVESLQKIEQEKNKLQKDMTEKTKKMTELEKKMKDSEEKMKKIEITSSVTKTKTTSLEKQLGEEREKTRVFEEKTAMMLAEKEKLENQLSEITTKTQAITAELLIKSNQIQSLEASVREERERATDASVKTGSAEKREITKLRQELDTSISQAKDLADKLEKIEQSTKANEENFKKVESDLNKVNTDLQSKASELEMDLQAERKKSERMKASQEKETKNKEQELTSLKTKLRAIESTSGASNKKVSELRDEYAAKIEKLESELSTERHAYEDLTSKYEILEEEHVVTKAQLVMDKENLQKQLASTKREHTNTENDLRALRETYNTKQDSWIKEKLDLQERMKELEERASRMDDHAANRLKNLIEEKKNEIEQMKKEAEVLADQSDYIKKENEELRRKLEDFDKVVKVNRNMTADTSAIDKELQETKNKLFQEEKSRKSEVAQLKLRYDGRVALIGEEIQSLQAQVGRFKRERDTFRHMLEGAQKTIADLKASPGKGKDKTTIGICDESEETRTKIASLDQQISCMEDELSEARLEASKLKTELVSERSAWEVKVSEMQSRVNELEEDRILASGRTKIPGMRTRMELAWQKERDEQHRLLQETSTLARDLRQTLFEVERERDKERLEAKRRHDQLKKTTEEEQEENRKKVTEVQCDLLELRDAHAKLRTTNEKLRREKERNEKDREEMRQTMAGKKRADADEERKITTMLEQIDELMRLAPDLFPQKQESLANVATPTPPRRLKGPKSRESSPSLERKEFRKESSVDRQYQIQSTVQRLADATEELRKYQRLSEDEKDRDRAKRTLGMRRAASTESDNPPEQTLKSKALNGGKGGVQRKGSLYRKSLSLEQTSASGQQDQPIWKNNDESDGSMSSLQSLDAGSEAMIDSRYYSLQRRETSVDSRLSGGSTQSEILPAGEKKKKKGILGKLKKLTKSRSIDDTNTATDYQSSVGQGSGSDISIAAEEKGSKKDLRERLSGIFKKSGSRSSSVERSKKEESPALPDRVASSTQRPLVRNSNASTVQRPSPARSDTSQTSSSSRPLAPKTTNHLPQPPGSASSTLRRGK